MFGYWKFHTRVGTFKIVPSTGSFEAMLDDEGLGAYATPELALNDLVDGHIFSPSSGIESDGCGLPNELAEWTFMKIQS